MIWDQSERGPRKDVGRGAHLTVYRARSVKADHVHDHCQKCGHACQRVDLKQEKYQFKSLQWVPSTEKEDTDPYRPPVGTTPSDDTPFVIEGSNKLPAGNTGVSYVVPRDLDHRADPHK